MGLDCYLRLRRAELEALRLEHLESSVDSSDVEGAAALLEGASALMAIEGYTEWVSTEPVPHSIGWDWSLTMGHDLLDVKPHSIRTNIMLVRDDGTDAGQAQTEHAIIDFLAGWDWSGTVLAAVQGCLEPQR